MVYVAEIDIRMNDKEEAIAEKARAETGLEIQVNIHDDGQIRSLQGLGYSAPFIFSEEIDGEAYHYTLRDSQAQGVRYTINTTTDQDDPLMPPLAAKTLKDRLFSDFYFFGAGFLAPDITGFNPLKTGFLPSWKEAFPSIPSPPPELA